MGVGVGGKMVATQLLCPLCRIVSRSEELQIMEDKDMLDVDWGAITWKDKKVLSRKSFAVLAENPLLTLFHFRSQWWKCIFFL